MLVFSSVHGINQWFGEDDDSVLIRDCVSSDPVTAAQLPHVVLEKL